MCAQAPTHAELYESIKLSQQQELLVGDMINTAKMMLFSDKQEDSRWTDGNLLEFDIYCCIVTGVVIALCHLHGRAPADEEVLGQIGQAEGWADPRPQEGPGVETRCRWRKPMDLL